VVRAAACCPTKSSASGAYLSDGAVGRQIGANPATRYVSDVNAGLPVILDDGTRTYVWGQGLAYAVSGTSIEVYHTDRLGSVRALTDGAGAVSATYRTDEWGVATASSGSSTQPYRYTGEPRDATGLSYLRARYYDPDLGRFLSRDTWAGSLARPISLNRYAYAGDNPVTHADPSGLAAQGGTGGRGVGTTPAKPKVLAPPPPGFCLPVVVAVGILGLPAIGVIDVAIGIANILALPSVVAELALLPADAAAAYASSFLLNVLQEALHRPCEYITVDPLKPFGG
jgi:RHS repeat-associated protein